MPTSREVLIRPFTPDEVEFVLSGGWSAVYPPGQLVVSRLDEATDGVWTMRRQMPEVAGTGQTNNGKEYHTVAVSVSLELPDLGIRVGDGSADYYNLTEYGDKVKSATTQALRNAAMRFGCGRHLSPDAVASDWLAWARLSDRDEFTTLLGAWIEFVNAMGPHIDTRTGEHRRGFDQYYIGAFHLQMKILFANLEALDIDPRKLPKPLRPGDIEALREQEEPRQRQQSRQEAPSAGGAASEPREFASKFDGRCSWGECENTWREGERVAYDPIARKAFCCRDHWARWKDASQARKPKEDEQEDFEKDDDDPFSE